MSGADTGMGVVEPVDADFGVVRSGMEEFGVKEVQLWGDDSLVRPLRRGSFFTGKQFNDCWRRSKGDCPPRLGMTKGARCLGEVGVAPLEPASVSPFIEA